MEFEIENGKLIKYNGTGPDVVIPDGVTVIAEDAFQCREKREYNKLFIPSSVNCIEYDAFPHFGNRFAEVHVPSLEAWINIQFESSGSPVSQFNDLFIDGEIIEHIVVPKEVKKINDYAFSGCRSLKTVKILGGTEIGRGAFEGCSQLEEVVLSDEIKKIGELAFEGCRLLKKINIPKKLTKIETNAFRMCGLTEVEIPEGVKEIGGGAFEFCRDLAKAILPKSLTKMGPKAFADCSKLESVDLYEGLTQMAGGVFDGCNCIKEVTVPSTVKKVLMTTFPRSIEKITIRCKMDVFDSKAFKDKKSLESVFVSEDEAEQAKKMIKKAKFYNLDGEPITKIKKKSESGADAGAALPPTKPGEIIVTYPADAPDMSAPVEPIVVSGGKPKGFAKPEIKEFYVQSGKFKFTFTLKVASKISTIWRRFYLCKDNESIYDPDEALAKAFNNSGYIDDKTGVYINNPLQGNIPASVSPLSSEEVEKRLIRFIREVNDCMRYETAKYIMDNVQKKKDGKLYKGRLLHLAYLNLVDDDGTTFELVVKNEDESVACIELRCVPVTR